ncbi:MAG: cyclophilin-like fold protein [Acidaminococcaceae bacterium]
MSIMTIFTGCSMDRQGGESRKTLNEAVKKSVDNAQKQAVDNKTANTTIITMTFGSSVVEAELDDSETSREFIARLPITLSMKRSDDREYYARIPKLSENGNAIPDYKNGDVTYYTGGPSLAVFFAKEGQSSQANLIRIGKITSDLSIFQQLENGVEVKIAVKNN